jgi:hypothetical protein
MTVETQPSTSQNARPTITPSRFADQNGSASLCHGCQSLAITDGSTVKASAHFRAPRSEDVMTDHANALARLARVVADRASERPLTWRLCEACRQLLGADSAAITIENTSVTRMTVATTDDLAARVEDLQEVLGEGPGWDAFRTGVPVITVMGDQSDQRWPLFSDAVRDIAASETLYAMPMRPSDTVLGVLTLLCWNRGSLSEELGTAQFLADAVGAALLRDPLTHADFGEGGPWSKRAEIHQATGMVCAQLKIDAEDALALLKAHAYAHELDLSGVARLVTERKLDFGVGE